MGVFKRGKIWYIRYTVDGKEKKLSVGTIKKDAENLLNDIHYSLKNGTYNEKYGKEKKNTFTLTEAITWYNKAYISIEIAAEKNRHGMNYELNRFAEIVGGSRLITEIKKNDIENYKIKRLADGVKPSSVDRALGIISGLFSRLYKSEYLEYNQLFGRIEYFNNSQPRRRTATKEELKIILDATSNQQVKLIIIIAMLTGLRLKDITTLDITEIDIQRALITKNQAKTKKPVIIPISNALNDTLKNYIDMRKIKIGKIFDITNEKMSNIFTGIKNSVGLLDLQFRDLRRTYATALLNDAGAELKIISELLGHSSTRMTDKVYTITDIEKKRELVNRIDILKN